MNARSSLLALVLAALCGALGTAGAAAAAHGGDPRLVGTAAAVALVHAPALLALGLLAPGRIALAIVPIVLLGLGTILFSGDLAARAFLAARLFPSAAPIGGVLLMLGWLSVGVLAFVPVRDRQRPL